MCIVGLCIMHFEVCIVMQCALLLCSLVCEVFNASVNLLAQRLTNIKAQLSVELSDGTNNSHRKWRSRPHKQRQKQTRNQPLNILHFYCFIVEPLNRYRLYNWFWHVFGSFVCLCLCLFMCRCLAVICKKLCWVYKYPGVFIHIVWNRECYYFAKGWGPLLAISIV